LKDDAHAAVSEPTLKLITSVENRLTGNGMGRRVAVIRAVVDVIWEAATTSWAFFHVSVRSKGGPSSCLTPVGETILSGDSETVARRCPKQDDGNLTRRVVRATFDLKSLPGEV
jgi:hypothetical protein